MSNPLTEDLNDTFPGVTVTLPTEGKFYPPGVLRESADPKEIDVRVLSMIDEQKYKDPFLLVSGKGLEQLIERVAPQVLKPDLLAEVDVEVILLATRLASYGTKLSVKHVCANPAEEILKDGNGDPVKDGNDEIVKRLVCEEENSIDLDLSEFITRYGPIGNDPGYELLLPRVGQTVYLQPTPYRTSANLLRHMMKHGKQVNDVMNRQADELIQDDSLFEQYEELLSFDIKLKLQTLMDCIVEVKSKSGQKVTDPDLILEWLHLLPNEDLKLIEDRVAENGKKLRELSLVQYDCVRCSHKNTFHLQMNPEVLFLSVPEASSQRATFSTTSETSSRHSTAHLRVLQK